MSNSNSELDLISVNAKLGRAEEHIEMLDAEINRWLESGTNSYTIERNEDQTQTYFRMKLSGAEPDYLRWTLIAGDAINNLRSSLDHLIYAIAKYETRNHSSPDIESLCFLIVDSPEKWADRNNRRRISGLSSGVQDAIKSLQPFIRKHPVLPPLLAILRDFSNADKHRLLKLAATAISAANVNFTSPNPVPKSIGIKTEPIEPGDIFAIIESDRPEPNLTIHEAQFTMEIALWHGLKDGEVNSMQGRTPAIWLMKQLAAEVKFAMGEIMAAVT
jgi:hypothetical protein